MWNEPVQVEVPDGATDACDACGEYLYGEDDTFGPYLSTGSAVFCYFCAGRATRGVR